MLILLVFGVFVASVVLWAEDNFLKEKYLVDVVEGGLEENNLEDSNGEPVRDETPMQVDGEYEYGVFKGESEVRVYSDVGMAEIEELMLQGYGLFVLLDGSELDQNRYNFDDVRYVQINDFDGDYFYTSKYGMEVGGGFMFTKKDFRVSFQVSNGSVVGFAL